MPDKGQSLLKVNQSSSLEWWRCQDARWAVKTNPKESLNQGKFMTILFPYLISVCLSQKSAFAWIENYISLNFSGIWSKLLLARGRIVAPTQIWKQFHKQKHTWFFRGKSRRSAHHCHHQHHHHHHHHLVFQISHYNNNRGWFRATEVILTHERRV